MKPEDRTPEEWVTHLARRHDAELPQLKELDALYQGTAPLHYIQPELKKELGDRLWSMSLGWPMLATDPLEERLDMMGWRYSDDGDNKTEGADLDDAILGADENLRRVMQDNDLVQESQLGHLDALVMRRAYTVVGANDGDTDSPLVTVESPLEMFADIDPRSRHVRAALRRWTDYEDSLTRMSERYATLYLANVTIWYEASSDDGTGWREVDRDQHGVGRPLVAALTNRARLAGRYGSSELTQPLLSLSHAANKIATDMMVSAEFHAFPLRALFGIGPEDLASQDGDRVSALQVLMGKLLTVPDIEGMNPVRPHQFDPSDLANFHNTLNQLAKHTAGLLGYDAHMFGFTTDNPASAEALRARETRMVKRVERKQTTFESGWKATAQNIRRVQEGDWDPKARRVEVIWRDAATPTRAAAADAALKLFNLPQPIVPLRQTREDLGYTPGQIRRMEAEDAKAGDEQMALFKLPTAAEQARTPAVAGAAG